MCRYLPSVLLLFCLCLPQAWADIRIGMLTFGEPADALLAWQDTATAISEHTGQRVTLLPLTPAELDQQVSQGALDFILANQYATVGYKKDHGVSQLLTLIPRDGRDPELAMGSTLVARPEVQLTSWQQLSQLRIISTDPKAFGGFLIFCGELARRGVNPATELKALQFVGFPQTALLDRLLSGEADLAVLPACVLEQAIASGRYPKEAFKVLLAEKHPGFQCQVSSRLYPYTALSKPGHTDNALATEVARALLALTEDSAAAKAAGYAGWSVPVNDSSVFALRRTLQQWPFQTNWHRVVSGVAPWLGAILLCLLLGYLHHLRIKRLVVQRTGALRSEMEQHSRTQKALLEQRNQFYRAQRVLLTGEMASGISHELKQPLAGIRYLAQGCLYRLGDEQQEIKDALGKLISQVDRAQDTIRRLREFCQQPCERRCFRLDELIRDTLALTAPELKRLGVVPVCELQAVTIDGDTNLLQQVLVNLLLNALDAMEHSEEPWLRLSLECNAKQCRLTISDAGTGLSEAKLERLFFPFETNKSNGLGLGMIICKRIVEEHGGSISAHNSERGLDMVVVLPRRVDDDPCISG
ncbi:PhnD/SsuA/transferrin family substrate-binding protein [Shewanella algae]|nr:PhnD/SsuA/transferrin family substrate-binding protein [Shewanella algae]